MALLTPHKFQIPPQCLLSCYYPSISAFSGIYLFPFDGAKCRTRYQPINLLLFGIDDRIELLRIFTGIPRFQYVREKYLNRSVCDLFRLDFPFNILP